MQQLLVDPASEPVVVRATGTEDRTVSTREIAQHQAQRAQRGSGRLATTGCEHGPEAVDPVGGPTKTPKSAVAANLGDGVRSGATDGGSGSSGTRTQNLLIKSQLL
jgi:hypothetical protein